MLHIHLFRLITNIHLNMHSDYEQVRTDDITIICLYLEGINDADLNGSFNGSINGHALDLTSIAVEVSCCSTTYTHNYTVLYIATTTVISLIQFAVFMSTDLLQLSVLLSASMYNDAVVC
jgi:hypothetical protein